MPDDRYNKKYKLDFSNLTAPPKQTTPKYNALQDFLRFAGGIAPAAGMGIGALAGGPAGAAAGGAIGTALGGASTFGADMMGRDEEERQRKLKAQQDEEAAQHQAALRMLQGL